MLKTTIAAVALMASFATPAFAVNTTADDRASCNASFHIGCKSTTTDAGVTSTDPVLQAPMPELAGSPLALLALAGALHVLRRKEAVG